MTRRPDTDAPATTAGVVGVPDLLALSAADSRRPGEWPDTPVIDRLVPRKITEICDADRRTTNLSTRAVATAVTAGAPLPNPQATRERFETILTAARAYLADEPSPRQINAAAGRISRAVLALANQLAAPARPDADDPARSHLPARNT